MRSLSIDVLGLPVPQGRPRFARVGKFVRTYDPKESSDWKSAVKLQALDCLRRDYPDWKLLIGAVRLKCVFRLMRPPSVSERKRPYPIVKPDLDNLVKAVKDALKGIVWVDDCQVVEMETEKRYDDPPGVHVDVREILTPADAGK